MNPTTEKIQIGQNDYNNLADWAKPNYQVQPNSVASTVPLQQPQSAIPATALQPTPAIKVPQTNTQDTTASGVIAGTQPSVDTALQNFNQAQQAVGTQAEDARANLTNQAETLFTQRANAQANQVNLENQLGLQEQQKALSQINSEIANEQIALRGEQEKIRQGYGTEAQKAISFNTLNDTYGRRLADLAIRQSAANQNITAIQTNAERQTKLLTAPLDTKIQFLSTFAKDNVDYLDKKQSEKLAFLVDDLKTQKQDIQALQNAKTQMITEIAQNGGGTNTQLIARIQNAKDIGEVTTLGAGSGFIGKLDRTLKQAQIDKIYQDMAEAKVKAMGLQQMKPEDYSRFQSDPNVKALSNSDKYLSQLAAYKNNIEKYGSGEVLNAEGRGALSAAYTDLVTAYKDFKNLGTWDAGSAALISMGIDEPSIWSRDKRVLSALNTLEDNAIKEMESANNTIIASPYSQTYEGRVLIEKNNGILKDKAIKKASNEDLLNSIPNVSGATPAVDNTTFFNQFNQ